MSKVASKSATKNLTDGSPMKLIIGFAIPLFFGNLFQQFYNIVDTMIVGKTLGVEALAGVGATGSVNFLIIGFCMGICSGFAIPVAQTFGAKDYRNMRKYIANGFYLAAVMAVVITFLVSVFCKNILRFMNTPDDIFVYSYNYILIIYLGIPATFLYNMLSGIIRSLGDSKTPLYFLIFSSLLNIALDFICILGLHMGVRGAGVATVASQLVSGILCLIYMNKKFEILHISGDEWRIETGHMRKLCYMGIPMGLQYSITALGSVILQTSINVLGSIFVAAQTAGAKVSLLFCCFFDALGATMATYGGQNVGAGKLDRVGKGLACANILGFIYASVAWVVIYFYGMKLATMFVDSTEISILQNARLFLICNASAYVLLVLVNNVRFLIQGMGYSGFAVLAGVMEMIARVIAGMVIVPVFGYLGACLASPLAWIMADAFLIPAYYYVCRRIKRAYGYAEKKKS